MKTLIKFLFAVPTIFASHSLANLVPRNDGPTAPPCSVPFTPYLYAGCYTDTKSPRALAFSPIGQNRQSMTVEKCAAVCKGNDFRYAGLEYYGECYCGNSIQGTPAADNACTFQCTGNKTQTCGGNNLISVYMDPTYPPSDSSDILSYTPQGCYTEGYNGRAVAFRQSQLSTKNLTTKACLGTCKSQNLPLAATEYGSECYCGVVLGNGTASAPDTECSTRCAGDSADFCGGRSRLNLYVASDLMSTEPCSPFVLPPPTVRSSTTTTSSSQSATYSTSDTGATTTTLSSDSTSSTISSAAASSSSLLAAAASSSIGDAYTSPSTFSETTASATPTSQVTQTTSSDLTTSDSSTSQTPLPYETTSETTLDTTTDESSQTSTMTSSTSDISTTDTATSESTSTSSPLNSVLSSASSASDSLTSENTVAQSTSSTSLTSSSTSTTSSSITSQTTTTTNSLTNMIPTTKTTTSSTKCISTVTPTPTCEYGCGKWCSKPIPIFSDHAARKFAVAECILQIANYFLSAGWPASLQCAKYQSWCQSISTYCGSICPGGKCSKKDCISRNPPFGGPTTTTTTSSTTINACPATSTTASSTSSSTAPIPTVSSICVLPSGPSGSGYNNGKWVGGIQPPALTCNNLRPDFAQLPLKLYTSKESSQCAGYARNAVVQACRDACGVQYNSCIGTYATSCKGQTQSGDRDSYDSARGKCTNQYYDCLAINRGASVGNRCMSFGQGWS